MPSGWVEMGAGPAYVGCDRVMSTETTGEECAQASAVEGADEGIAGQRAGAGRAADEFVVGEAERAADDDTENDAENHGEVRFLEVKPTGIRRTAGLPA